MIAAGYSYTQENITFQKPSEEILKLADYERPPSVFMNSNKDVMIFVYRPTYKELKDLNQEEMRLAGLRINPKTNISSTLSYVNNIKIKKVGEKKEIQVKNLPEEARLSYFSFSPDEKYLSFTNTTSNGVELWVVELATGKAKKVTKDNLNANMGRPYSWMKDSNSFIVCALPSDRPELLDEDSFLPTGPIVATSSGEVSQNRTYQDMLKNKFDEENFKILTTSELFIVEVNGKMTPFANAGIYSGISVSPDGEYVMVSSIHEPFSYMVPYYRFPFTTKIYDAKGNHIKEVNNVPLNEVLPQGFSSVREGKRSMGWRADQPSTLYYVEALDRGDQANEVEFRDEVFIWEAPFTKEPESLFKLSSRYAGINWGNEENLFISEFWFDTRNIKTHWLNPTTKESKLIVDRNYQDVYSDPGDFYTEKNKFGRETVVVKENKVHLIGDGYTKEGQFPYIDELDLTTFETKRIYTINSTDKKEDIIDVLNLDRGEILLRSQSPVDYPNFYIRNYKQNIDIQLYPH